MDLTEGVNNLMETIKGQNLTIKTLQERNRELERIKSPLHELKDRLIHLIDVSNPDYCEGVNDCIKEIDNLLKPETKGAANG